MPDLPGADHPNVHTYTSYILEHAPWPIDENVTLIGHSSGAVEILHLLQNLPADKKVKAAIFVGAFTKELASHPNWNMLTGLFLDPFDFALIKSKAAHITFVHSEDDPHCPLEQARYLAGELAAELVIFPDKKHFSVNTDPSFTKFPEILDIINKASV